MGALDNFARNSAAWIHESKHSTGFFPVLVVLSILSPVALFSYLRDPSGQLAILSTWLLVVLVVVFILMFIGMAVWRPDFCRSEQHIETKMRIDATSQQKGEPPRLIDDLPALAIGNPALSAEAVAATPIEAPEVSSSEEDAKS